MDFSIIKIDNLTKSIKGDIILDKINLNLTKGKIYGFIGHNGSGKSMLFKAICGLIKPSEGNIFVEGKKIGSEVSFPESIGILIESPGFIPNCSGFKNLKLLADIKGNIGNDKIKRAMEVVGLDYTNKKNVKKYSLGMKQKLGIAQAIMENPNILILDEPMNGLDNKSVETIRNLIKHLKNKGKTILLTSHNKDDIELLCDEVFQLDNGQLNSISKINW